MKKVLFTILAMLLSMMASAYVVYDVCWIEGICYHFDTTGKTAMVANNGTEGIYSGEVVIPSEVTYNGEQYSVTSIGDNAFSQCINLTSVMIPNSVTSIGQYAFCECQSLKYIVIPHHVKMIRNQAFKNCRNLRTIIMGKGIENIEYEAFKGCDSLYSVLCCAEQAPTMDRDVFAESNVANATLYVPYRYFGNYNNADQWKMFGTIERYFGEFYDAYVDGFYYKFDTNSKTASITYLSYIINNENAYSGNVTIPETVKYNGELYHVTKIGYNAMGSCEGVISVSIPDNITEIEHDAFYRCKYLRSISFPSYIKSIEHGTCQYCESLESVVVPDYVQIIHDQAFQYCRSLSTVTIGKGVEKIEYEAFRSCENLTNVYSYAEQVPLLERDEFERRVFDGVNVSNVTLHVPMALLEDYKQAEQWKEFGAIIAFDNPEPIEITIDDIVYKADLIEKTATVYRGNNNSSVSIPNTINAYGITCDVTRIESSAFSGCWNVSSLTIPESVVSIGNGALDDTQWYNNQPNGLVYAGLVAYRYKGDMQPYSKLALKKGTKGIADYALNSCFNLISIILPESLESIGVGAFRYCRELTSLDIPHNVKAIGDHAFEKCYGLTTIIVPDGVPTIGNYTFYQCSGLTSISIGKNITKIGDNAFYNCYRLTSIVLPAKVETIGNGSFAGCSSITDVYCFAQTVPITANNAFQNEYIRNAILHVPALSIEDYSYEEPWINFKEIVALTNQELSIRHIEKCEDKINPIYSFSGKKINHARKGSLVIIKGKNCAKKIILY